MRKPKNSSEFALYVRNFIFGVEDSLVSTVGLLSGVAVGGLPKNEIILTGIVLIFVEAFSMGVGSYLSENSAEQFLTKSDKKANAISVPGALIMFFSYFASGFIPLAPYLVFEVSAAFWVSILFSITALFTLGVVSANIFKISLIKQGVRMAVIGGIAIAVGALVGTFVHA